MPISRIRNRSAVYELLVNCGARKLFNAEKRGTVRCAVMCAVTILLKQQAGRTNLDKPFTKPHNDNMLYAISYILDYLLTCE